MDTMRIVKAAAAAAAAFAAAPSPASADAGSFVDTAERAITRGHGGMCSLEMKPVAKGGYYPCVDIGPYRYVRGYGRVMGLVLTEGKEPFLVLDGKPGSPAFLYDGPWQADMPARAAIWWADHVEGGAEASRRQAEASADLKAASDYIRRLRGEEEPAAKAQAPAADPAPSAQVEDISPDIKELLTAR